LKHVTPGELPQDDPQNPSTVAQHAVGGGLAVAAIILVAISLRPGIVSVGPILPSIIDEFKLTHATAALLTSIPDVLMGLLALPTPWLARRVGRDPVLLMALVLLCLSIFGRAFAPNPSILLAATVGVGAGIAIAGALMAGFIKARFPTRAAMLMGIYATALSLGSTVSAALTGPVAVNASSGWRLASGMWSGLAVISVIAWLAVTISERRHHATVPVVATRTKLPLRSGTAWLVALFFACDNFLFYSLLSWTSPMYRELGLDATIAGLVLASFTACFMVANPIFGYLSKSVDRRVWLAICSVIAVAGLLGIATMPAAAPFVFVPLAAIGLGGGFTLGMTLPLDNTTSVDEANVWNAFVLTVGYLIASTGPLIVGRLRDFDGDFHAGMWVCVGAAVIMLGLSPFLRPRKA